MTRKHLLIMAICCTVPIMALAAIFLFQIQISTVFLLGLILLCPALHVWMMRRHMGNSTIASEKSDALVSADNNNSQQPLSIRE